MSIPRILVIAGSDSGGGAGIQADIKTIAILGGHAMTAITAITAQNTLGVQAVMPVPTRMVLAQIESVMEDIGIDAVKIGMVGSAETAHAVADWLETHSGKSVPIVFDPVMVATSGDTLADPSTVAAFDRLAARSSVVTPNTPELERLSGRSILNETDQGAAAEEFMRRANAGAVLAKGGHAVENRGFHGILDTLYLLDQNGWREWFWENTRIETRNTHGTGCTLASAIATGLGAGLTLDAAIERGIAFVRASLERAPGLGHGNGPMGQQFATGF